MSTYPGGKGGAGVAQRLINEIPPHRVLVVPFAGHCAVSRLIRPAERTILIDADADVCEWWDSWRRKHRRRDLEVHHADGIEWLRHWFGLTAYARCDRMTPNPAAEYSQAGGVFVFADPPYVMSTRTGAQYRHEMSDDDHARWLGVARSIAALASVMVCGYRCELYLRLLAWRKFDHDVMTRGGVKSERVWMSYPRPSVLHDGRFLGRDRRERERIRRRRINWRKQLADMSPAERAAMLDTLNELRQ